MPRILIAEDDPNILEGLATLLASEGHEVETAANGAVALEKFRKRKPDLLLLDVMMPQKSGYDVCREIRAKDTATPIIMLTAKGEELDKVLGLTLGADDYVTKPFGVRELLARVAAVLRRTRENGHSCPFRTPGTDRNVRSPLAHETDRNVRSPLALGTDKNVRSPLKDEFTFAGLRVDPKRYCVIVAKGRELPLSDRELKLIQFMRSHAGEVLTRDQLLNAVWGVNYFGNTRTLDQHIVQLRKKFGANSIATVHGMGYRCNP